MKFAILLINKKGHIVKYREVGSWRDHAAELYAGVRNRLQATDHALRVELVDIADHKYKTVLSHDQRWPKNQKED